MYGRVSNHEIVIPYLALFVGSGVRRVWHGRRCVWSVDDGVERVWVLLWCGRGEGMDVSACGVWMLVWVRRRAERGL